MVTRQGLRWIGIGLAAGLIISIAFAQLLAGLLYGVRPADPLVLVGVDGAARSHRLPVLPLAGPANQPPRSDDGAAGAIGFPAPSPGR